MTDSLHAIQGLCSAASMQEPREQLTCLPTRMRTAGCSGVVCFMVALHSCSISTPTRLTGGADSDGRIRSYDSGVPVAAAAAAAATDPASAAAAVAGVLSLVAGKPWPSALGSCGVHKAQSVTVHKVGTT